MYLREATGSRSWLPLAATPGWLYCFFRHRSSSAATNKYNPITKGMNIHNAVGLVWALCPPNVSTKASVKSLASYALNRNAQIPMNSAEQRYFIFSTPTSQAQRRSLKTRQKGCKVNPWSPNTSGNEDGNTSRSQGGPGWRWFWWVEWRVADVGLAAVSPVMVTGRER